MPSSKHSYGRRKLVIRNTLSWTLKRVQWTNMKINIILWCSTSKAEGHVGPSINVTIEVTSTVYTGSSCGYIWNTIILGLGLWVLGKKTWDIRAAQAPPSDFLRPKTDNASSRKSAISSKMPTCFLSASPNKLKNRPLPHEHSWGLAFILYIL